LVFNYLKIKTLTGPQHMPFEHSEI